MIAFVEMSFDRNDTWQFHQHIIQKYHTPYFHILKNILFDYLLNLVFIVFSFKYSFSLKYSPQVFPLVFNNNQLITSVFRKATFSGVFTNFKSFMPVTYKFSLVHTLLHRSFSICSSYEKFHEEIVLLKEVFKKNEYPQLFIDKCIKKYLNKLFVPKRIIHTVDKKQVLLVLPFLGPLSFQIRSRLQKCLKNYIPYCSLKVVYQSKSIISNLFHFKDVVNTKLSSHIV